MKTALLVPALFAVLAATVSCKARSGDSQLQTDIPLGPSDPNASAAQEKIRLVEAHAEVMDKLSDRLPKPIGWAVKGYLVAIDRKKCDAAASCIDRLYDAIYNARNNEHVDMWKINNPNCTQADLQRGFEKWQAAMTGSTAIKELSDYAEAEAIKYTRYKCELLKSVFTEVSGANGGDQTAQGNPMCTQVSLPNLCEMGRVKPVVPADRIVGQCGIGAPHARILDIPSTGGSMCQYTCGALALGWGTWSPGGTATPVRNADSAYCSGSRCPTGYRDLGFFDVNAPSKSYDCSYCCARN